MTILSVIENMIVDEKYIQELHDDSIDIESDVIEKARQGDAEAIYNIGCICVSKEEKEKAILWLGTSSALGYDESQIQLGNLFFETNSQAALRWYELARDHGQEHAHARLGDYYLRKSAYVKAHDEYLQAAKHGDPYSQNCLGELYVTSYTFNNSECNDLYSDENPSTALEWFQKDANQNYASGQFNIAKLYEEGLGVTRNWYEALYWYEKAKKGGYGPSFDKVKSLNIEGYFFIPQNDVIDVPSDVIEKAKQGNAEAIYTIGSAYASGHATAGRDYPPAQYNLGVMFEYGHGLKEAAKYQVLQLYQKSYDGGIEAALEGIGRLDNDGYFYVPPQNASLSATKNEPEASERETGEQDIIKISKVKKLLHSLRVNNAETVKVEALEKLIDNLALNRMAKLNNILNST